MFDVQIVNGKRGIEKEHCFKWLGKSKLKKKSLVPTKFPIFLKLCFESFTKQITQNLIEIFVLQDHQLNFVAANICPNKVHLQQMRPYRFLQSLLQLQFLPASIKTACLNNSEI